MSRHQQVDDVMQRIWGNPEAIMLIFAGSAAEFAVNKAVDWLFWTNALPDEPIERFFETVRFAQEIAFGDERARAIVIAAVNGTHRRVEKSRDDKIPQWAHRDVLFMLVDYSERAHCIVFGPMTRQERLYHFEAFMRTGSELYIEDLPQTYGEYQIMRRSHLQEHLAHGLHTDHLYASYRSHLGAGRMVALLYLQASLVPVEVRRLLGLKQKRWVTRLLKLYRYAPTEKLVRRLNRVLLPGRYSSQLAALAAYPQSHLAASVHATHPDHIAARTANPGRLWPAT